MEEKLIIGVVVFISLIAHVWIYKWVKFKIDESAIINFFKKGSEQCFWHSDEISLNTSIKPHRVAMVCSKSKEIKRNSQDKDSWGRILP